MLLLSRGAAAGGAARVSAGAARVSAGATRGLATGLERPLRPAAAGRARWALRGGAALGAAGCAALAWRSSHDLGTERALKFWSTALPIFLHYRWVQHSPLMASEAERAAAYEALHERYAPVIERHTLRLRGFYLKLAQVVSTVDYFLPPQYLRWCKKLQDEAPTAMGATQVRAIIERELGRPVESVFSSFEDKPCGVASIGQVHRAVLRGSGRVVAVKVLGPDIEAMFRSDMGTVLDFCRLAMPQHVGPMKEIEAQFETEFDFAGEARNLIEAHDNIMPRFGHLVCIPAPQLELCSKAVLVMDFLEGPSLVKGARQQLERYAKRLGRPYAEVEAEQLALLRGGRLKDVSGEAAKMRHYQRALDAQAAAANAARTAWNWTLGWALGRPFALQPAERLLNVAEALRVVSLVHGYEIMVDGAFNGDPHPGNVLLMPDGRYGLIDYGQFMRVDKAGRLAYARLIVALAEDNQRDAVGALKELGLKTRNDIPEAQFLLAQFWHDRGDEEVTGGRNPQEFMEFLEGKDPLLENPGVLVFAGRASVLLRGAGNFFGLHLSMAKMWKPIALKVLAGCPQDITI